MKQPQNKTSSLPIINDIIQDILRSRKEEVEQWFADISSKTPPFFYNSVDLRHSGFKLAPVDTNLFPAGFNNLNENELQKAKKTAANFFSLYYPDVKNVLILAEDHTRNTFYLDNIAALIDIIEGAGKNVQITNFSTSEQGNDVQLESRNGTMLTFKPITRDGDIIKTKDGFEPDFILVNNDLTEGAPDLLKDIKQHISPPVGFGWYQRRKTSHFETYYNMVREFCHKFDVDPWLLGTYFERCGVVNFKEKKGIECVALRVDKTISYIQKKYDEYGIKEQPYVFIKSDRGTYGMGIMTAKSGDEVFQMSKNIRKKMNTIKGGVINTEVIIQEGIHTIDKVDHHPAEPMIYMVGGEATGCIYRFNTDKDSYGNLNAKGMQFASMQDQSGDEKICCAFAIVAKIASHAAAWECYDASYNI